MTRTCAVREWNGATGELTRDFVHHGDEQGHVFVHGEAVSVRELRRDLRSTVGLPAEFTSMSGYWRRGGTEDRWRSGKHEWNVAIEAEDAAAPVG